MDLRAAEITVVYDAFSDTATALSGRYVFWADRAQTDEEEQQWMDKVIALRDERRRVDPSDREAMIECMQRWRDELHQLRDPE